MKSIFTFILIMVFTFSANAQAEQYMMSARKLEVRSGPGLNYNVVAEVPQGTQVYVIASGYGEWSTVQYKRLNGFVKTAYLAEDSRIAEAERAAREAEAKKAAARAAAEAAIARAEKAKRAAEEAARRAIAEAEAAKRAVEAEEAKAIAAAEAARRNKDAISRKTAQEAEETRRAVEEGNRRAARGEVATTPIESTTPSYGSSTTRSTARRSAAAAPSRVTREDKFSSWEKKVYKSGATPRSFGKFKGKFDYKLDNYLKINVGKNTEVVVKLVKMGKTEREDQVVRVSYINTNSTQYIRNIPEGEYYCVIAYGKEWKEKKEGGKVFGTFTKNALYEKGQDVLNFNAVKTDKGINVPSYTLSLDLLPNGTLGSGSIQDDITPDAFNKF